MNKKLKLSNLLLEVELTNRVLMTVVKKWYGDTPTEEQIEKAKDYGRKFNDIKNRLVITAPEVITFINRYPNFSIDSLKDITAYSLEQIRHILTDFFDLGDDEDNVTIAVIPEVFQGRSLPPTPERIEVSKGLWFSDRNKIVDEDGFRVYAIDNMKESIMFSYYNEALTKIEPYRSQMYNSPWCIGRHNESSNLWKTYRTSHGRTFYFVIDESKSPEVENNVQVSQYYISALQYSTDLSTNVSYEANLPIGHGYRLTTILNSGVDRQVSSNELYTIYPKLRGHLDNITQKRFSEQEVGRPTALIDMVDENESNQYEFAKMTKNIKKQYIEIPKPITKLRSWQSMDDGLKQKYFDLTTRNTVYERFSGREVLFAIRSKQSELTSLKRRLDSEGFTDGVYGLFRRFFDTDYDMPQKKSKNSDRIVLAQHKFNKKYGLFDNNKVDFLVKDGIKYSDEYIRKASLLKDNAGNGYIVEIYTKSGNLSDDTNFYYVTNKNDYKSLDQGYFMTHKSYMELLEKETDSTQYKDFNPTAKSDLKEIKKGR